MTVARGLACGLANDGFGLFKTVASDKAHVFLSLAKMTVSGILIAIRCPLGSSVLMSLIAGSRSLPRRHKSENIDAYC
jgi:putative effector of murein hydrolase